MSSFQAPGHLLIKLSQRILYHNGLLSPVPALSRCVASDAAGSHTGTATTPAPAPGAGANSNATAGSSTNMSNQGSTPVEQHSPWVEVVHEATGQTYWWNQQTGQTTELGHPRPFTHRGGSTGAAGAQTADPRAEVPLPDKTGEYAAIGLFAGVFLGWASQFF